MADTQPTVLVLGGGPDDEREISLASAAGVARAARRAGLAVTERTIDPDSVDTMDGADGVVFPVLHGPWGEGGPLQRVLERSNRAFVGSGSTAARVLIDKLATKGLASEAGLGEVGVGVPRAWALSAGDGEPPAPLPLVVKPVHGGSSYGLHVCRARADWDAAMAEVRVRPDVVWMAEDAIAGREITQPMLEVGDGATAGVAESRWRALPIIELRPAGGVFDHAAKYERDDTETVVRPTLPAGVAEAVADASRRLLDAAGARSLARLDFLVRAGDDRPMLLEANTMPGFTEQSLFPVAARAAGLEMPALIRGLVERAAGG